MQGIGWVTTEELVYRSDGELLTASPTTYKIPNVTDLPRVFHLDFLENDLLPGELQRNYEETWGHPTQA